MKGKAQLDNSLTSDTHSTSCPNDDYKCYSHANETRIKWCGREDIPLGKYRWNQLKKIPHHYLWATIKSNSAVSVNWKFGHKSLTDFDIQ